MRLLLFLITNSLPISNPFQLRAVRAFHEALVWQAVYIEFEAYLLGKLLRLFVNQTIQAWAEALSVDDLIFLFEPSIKSKVQRRGAENLDEEVVGAARNSLLLLHRDLWQQSLEPACVVHSLARPQQAVLREVNSNLYATLPAAFLHIEHASDMLGGVVRDFRSKEKANAVRSTIGWK